MPLTLDPSWTAYKEALARLAEASQRVETARLGASGERQAAEQVFKDALRAYDDARQRMERARSHESDRVEITAPGPHMDGQVVRLSGLAFTQQHITFARDQDQTSSG
jgi:hypothetical protein